jgi:hypothetical protein
MDPRGPSSGPGEPNSAKMDPRGTRRAEFSPDAPARHPEGTPGSPQVLGTALRPVWAVGSAVASGRVRWGGPGARGRAFSAGPPLATAVRRPEDAAAASAGKSRSVAWRRPPAFVGTDLHQRPPTRPLSRRNRSAAAVHGAESPPATSCGGPPGHPFGPAVACRSHDSTGPGASRKPQPATSPEPARTARISFVPLGRPRWPGKAPVKVSRMARNPA